MLVAAPSRPTTLPPISATVERQVAAAVSLQPSTTAESDVGIVLPSAPRVGIQSPRHHHHHVSLPSSDVVTAAIGQLSADVEESLRELDEALELSMMLEGDSGC